MYQLRLSKSIGFLNDSFYEDLKEAVALGYDALDFDLCAKWKEREAEIEGYKSLREGLEAVKASGLYFNGVHISFGHHWDFSATEEEKRREAVENFAEIAPLIDEYTPHFYIIHGSFEPIPLENRAAKIAALKKSLAEMLQITKTTIAVEILPRTCLLNTAAEAIEIIDSMASEQIKVCVDVNHFLQEPAEEGVLALGNRIVTTHISDHDYENERHWLPGQGKINWNALIGALEKIGYTGVFNYEVGETLATVKENYEKLFADYNG
ncbi:MAG: sugar phosphate isomerase/epimerase [Clostridia bacterium]|nr:sugar phosphate isomerase/epimerase [Clostridia bacterium]